MTRFLATCAAALCTPMVSLAQQWTQDQHLLRANPQSNSYFGNAVAIEGNTIAVGAYRENAPGPNSGAVHLFERTADGWELQQQVVPNQTENGSEFGISVALDEDILLVGAWAYDGPETNSGAAFVYVRSGTTWNLQQVLTDPNGQSGDRFGWSVDVCGDLAIVGAPRDDTNFADDGSAVVFQRSGSFWSWLKTLVSVNPEEDGDFGWSVACSGERFVVGAPKEDDMGIDSGAAFVFDCEEPSEHQLFSSTTTAHDNYGWDVDIDGDRVVVGAPFEGSNSDGAVASFVRDAGAGLWLFEARANPGAPTQVRLGQSVALDGERLIAGAPQDDLVGDRGGAVYAFRLESSTWVSDDIDPLPPLCAAEGSSNDRFGCDVGLSDSTCVVGARLHDKALTDEGVAFTFERQAAAFELYGFGDGSGTPCPCSNESEVGREQGCVNSTGVGGVALALGSDSLTTNHLHLEGHNLLPGSAALLFAGNQRVAGGNGLPFGDGLRVAGGQVRRTGLAVPDGCGRASWTPDLSSLPWGPGVRHFQIWYRDPDNSPCGRNFNLTNGVSVTFTP